MNLEQRIIMSYTMGMSAKDICRVEDIWQSTVYAALKKNNISTRRITRSYSVAYKKRTIEYMVENTLTRYQVAREFNIPKDNIYNWAKQSYDLARYNSISITSRLGTTERTLEEEISYRVAQANRPAAIVVNRTLDEVDNRPRGEVRR